MLTASDIQQPRSPKALRDFVIALKERVRANEEERHRGILKKDLYKEFLDEIVPLSRFAMIQYPEKYRILPVLGNQGYDAVVLDEFNEEIERIEITCPGNGAEKANDARLIVNQGVGSFHSGEPGYDFDDLFVFVLATCREKARKDYSDCTLVVAIEPISPFSGFEKRYEDQIAALVNEIRLIKFNAKRVALLILPDRLVNVHDLPAGGGQTT